MSRVLPDPQIVHLRAMRAGDIAMALGPNPATVGVDRNAAQSPFASASFAPLSTFDVNGSDAAPSSTAGPVSLSTAADLAYDAVKSVNLSGGSFPEIFEELVTLSGTPSIELAVNSSFPVLTVAHVTSVVP